MHIAVHSFMATTATRGSCLVPSYQIDAHFRGRWSPHMPTTCADKIPRMPTRNFHMTHAMHVPVHFRGISYSVGPTCVHMKHWDIRQIGDTKKKLSTQRIYGKPQNVRFLRLFLIKRYCTSNIASAKRRVNIDLGVITCQWGSPTEHHVRTTLMRVTLATTRTACWRRYTEG